MKLKEAIINLGDYDCMVYFISWCNYYIEKIGGINLSAMFEELKVSPEKFEDLPNGHFMLSRYTIEKPIEHNNLVKLTKTNHNGIKIIEYGLDMSTIKIEGPE